jgi:hypothetical protein
MNVFEGSRRIAYLAGSVAAAVTLIVAASYDPSISLKYSIAHPAAGFQRTDQPCPSESGRTFFATPSKAGTTVFIELCLLAMEFEQVAGGAKVYLVPYKVNERKDTLYAAYHSNEVDAYKKELEARFEIPRADEEWIESERSRLNWENWKESLQNLGAGLTIFFGFVWAMGWIVRGFAGIPRGMDSKPKSDG